MELQPELIPVHAVDNGMVLYIPDSGGARAVKTAAMTLAAGPIGLAAGMLSRGLRAECQTCGKVFARSPYSAAIQEKIIALVSRGELVIRSYTPPPIPEYRYGESHAIATPKKKEEDSRLSQFTAAAVFAMLFWGCVVYGVSSRRFDAGNVFADLVCFVIAAALTLAAIQSLRKPVETVPKIPSRELSLSGPPRMDRRSTVSCIISVILLALAITGWSKGVPAWCEGPLVLLVIVSSVTFVDAVLRTMIVSAGTQERDTLKSG